MNSPEKNNCRKKALRLIILIMVLLFAVMACAACGRVNKSSSQANSTRTVTDSAGRKVQIPKTCAHIAALDSFTAEAMVMIGAGDQMCACPNGTKTDEILRMIYPDLP